MFGRLGGDFGKLGALSAAAASGPYVFANSEAEALVAAMTVEPDDARKALIDALVGGLKADGVWAAMTADADSRLLVFAAHDAQAARINWLKPSSSVAVENSPAFTADRQYATDGAASSINLGVTPASFGQDSLCLGIWSRTAGRTTGSCAGTYDGNSGVSIQPNSTLGTSQGRANAGANGAVATANGTNLAGNGMFAVNRSGPTSQQLYKAGVLIAQNTTEASTAPLGTPIRLGFFNNAYIAFSFAAAFVCPSLTGAQHLALYTRLNTYMTAIGATS